MPLPSMVECVPNFSEGRRTNVVSQIERAMAGSQVQMLDRHSDPDHNRSVITFAGPDEAVLDAALAGAASAIELIDLRRHEGVHPRFGAVDVIPFVPLGGMSSDVCSGLARRAGAALAQRHDVPVYLYGAAAKPGRPNTLSVLRQGGFEALLARGEEILPPDYGPRRAHPTAGAVAVGSRPLLIALNVELATADVDVAGRIAAQLRASSGGLPAVQALGLSLPSRGTVQVSMNLLDFATTSPAQVLGVLVLAAGREQVRIASCELVGLVPEAALSGLDELDLPGLPGQDATIEARLSIG